MATSNPMYPPHIDARLQITAAVSLIRKSELFHWEPDAPHGFLAGDRATFESRAVPGLDLHFGRLMRWILFSAGAELLAKGVCLAHDLPIRSPQLVTRYPSDQTSHTIADWLATLYTAPETLRTKTAVHYGQLGGLVYPRRQPNHQPSQPAWFTLLLNEVPHSQTDREQLFGAYRFLASTIRNRDAHAYIPKVRDEHHWAAGKVMLPAFNLLVSWVPPDAGATVNQWMETHGDFVSQLE
jgi:hypothetical protein